MGKETVGCVGGCGQELVILLEDEEPRRKASNPEAYSEGQNTAQEVEVEDEEDWRQDAQEGLVSRYAEMIATAHEEGCLWRRRGCDGKTLHWLAFLSRNVPAIAC